MIAAEQNSKKWLRLTLLATAAIVLIVQIPLLLEVEYVHEDLRFFYWLFRFIDPTLFAGDPLLGYQFAEVDLGFTTLLFNKVSLMYGTLYAILSPLLSPFIFSKILIFPLALISSYFLFRIAEQITNPFKAFLLCAIFTLIVAVPYSSIDFSSGLPRSFTLPLLLSMAYFMIKENHLGMAVTLVTGLVYPPIFLTILITYGVKFGFETIRRRRLAFTGKQIAVFGIALFISLLLLVPAILTGLNTVPVGPEGAQNVTVFSSPLFGEDGRYALLAPNPLTANGGLLDRGLIGLYSLGFVFALIPIALVLRGRFRNLPAPFWYLALASLIGFAISWLAILFTPSATFHMPSRYMRGTLFLIGLILFVVNGPLAIQVGSKSLANNRGNFDVALLFFSIGGLVVVYLSGISRMLTAVIALLVIVNAVLVFARKRTSTLDRKDVTPATPKEKDDEITNKWLRFHAVLVTSALVLPFLFYIQGPDKFHRPFVYTAELINFIKTLPQDTLISGYPCLLNDVPLYAQHTILFSCETESRDMGMMTATLDAYYAESDEAVLAFCRKYEVDYLVASPITFSEDFLNQELIIFEPLNSILKRVLEGRSEYALEQVPVEARLFQNETYYVVACTADVLISSHSPTTYMKN